MSGVGDKCDAIAITAASLGFSVDTRDVLRVSGVFDAICTLPPPYLLAEYIEMRAALDAAENCGDYATAAKLTAELLMIPQEECWRDTYHNTVVDSGARYLLDNALAGSGFTAALYMSMISNASFSAIANGDTMASHAGWTESSAFSNATRIAAAWSAASSRTKALSAGLAFNINGTDTIKGSFITTVSTKGGSTGTLYSAGLFSDGDQPVVSGNTLTISYSASV